MIASRRNFIFGASAFLAAPSIVRVASLMPVSVAAFSAPLPFGMFQGAGEPKFVAAPGSIYARTDNWGAYVRTTDGWKPISFEQPPRPAYGRSISADILDGQKAVNDAYRGLPHALS